MRKVNCCRMYSSMLFCCVLCVNLTLIAMLSSVFRNTKSEEWLGQTPSGGALSTLSHLKWCQNQTRLTPCLNRSIHNFNHTNYCLFITNYTCFNKIYSLRGKWDGVLNLVNFHLTVTYGGRGHWLVRMEWRPAGWSVCLSLLVFPCTIKPRSSLLAPTHPGGPWKMGVKPLCMYVCVLLIYNFMFKSAFLWPQSMIAAVAQLLSFLFRSLSISCTIWEMAGCSGCTYISHAPYLVIYSIL